VTNNKFRYRYFYLWICVLYITVIISTNGPLFRLKAVIGAEKTVISSQLNILLNKADNAYVAGNYQAAIAIWLKIIKEQKPIGKNR